MEVVPDDGVTTERDPTISPTTSEGPAAASDDGNETVWDFKYPVR